MRNFSFNLQNLSQNFVLLSYIHVTLNGRILSLHSVMWGAMMVSGVGWFRFHLSKKSQ